jgi:hypothetical protein
MDQYTTWSISTVPPPVSGELGEYTFSLMQFGQPIAPKVTEWLKESNA